MKIKEFKITKLFGERDYTFPFNDNKLILVGENGCGKTAAITLFDTYMSNVPSIDYEDVCDSFDILLSDGESYKQSNMGCNVLFGSECGLPSTKDIKLRLQSKTLTTDFVVTMNKFLNDKELVVKDGEIQLFNTSGGQIPLDSYILSMGELRLFDLFCTLDSLSQKGNVFVVLDTPETSLSMTSQKLLLTEINYYPNVVGFFVTTHSPFIFDNSFGDCTIGMGMCEC